jgi:meckelin
VLTLYDENQPACSNFRKLQTAKPVYQDNNWYTDFPYLFYSKAQEFKTFLKKVSFNQNPSSTTNILPLFIAKYDFYGNYLGIEPLGEHIFACPKVTSSFAESFKALGNNMKVVCTINITNYMNSQDMPIFYELFLQFDNLSYIDVPVLVKNYYSAEQTYDNNGTDKTKYVYTRRFMILDSLTGKSSSADVDPILRWASKIVLNVKMDPNSKENVFVPTLEIEYTGIANKTVFDQPKYMIQTFNFQSQYFMETTKFMKSSLYILIVLNVVVVVVWIFRIYLFNKLNPSQYYRGNFSLYMLFKAIFLLLDTWSSILFWFIYAISLYWVAIYKFENRMFALLPENSWAKSYKAIDVIYAVVAVSKIIVVLCKVLESATVDIILVDSEKPKIKKNVAEHFGKEESKEEEEVSAWRSLFVANEYCELQKYRLIKIELTILIFLFFYEGLNWKNFALESPYIDLALKYIIMNRYFTFFIVITLFLIIGTLQWVIRKIGGIWFPHKLHDFIDLCSLCNITMFIFDDILHGYYVHGCSPFGKADVNSKTLNLYLAHEKKGEGQSRGLIQDENNSAHNLQTFEIYVSHMMKRTYDYSIVQPFETERDTAIRMNLNKSYSKIPCVPSVIVTSMDIKSLSDRKKRMTQLLKSQYLEKVLSNPSKFILEKTMCQRLFGIVPIDLSNLEISYFFKDERMSFTNLLMIGMEWDFLFMYILILFYLIRMIGVNYGVILAYIIDQFFCWLFGFLGNRNLAAKTYTDERFLL